jgi:protein-L-isoaspartate O-methyltransferase
VTRAPRKFNPCRVAPEWAGAFRAVPRTTFLPLRMWPLDTATGRHAYVHRDQDPAGWRRAADSDAPITVQWDDGRHWGCKPGEVPSSSSSTPSVVSGMLTALHAEPGMRALEIGTGTGWSAALLAHRLGDDHVVTVEVDPEVAEQARANLKRIGAAPHVITADGAAGWPPGAPYDRLIATCGLRRIPHAWVRQTRPGGVILAPWGTEFAPFEALARLVVAEDGATASGRFTTGTTGTTGMVRLMKLRSHRVPRPRHAEYATRTGSWPHGADTTATDLGPETVDHAPDDPVPFILGLAVPDCAHACGKEAGEIVAWFHSLNDRSWAAARFRPGEPGGDVYQHGPRRLWDELDAAWRWWHAQGRPAIDRFGLTVTPDGEKAWLDTPGHPVGF